MAFSTRHFSTALQVLAVDGALKESVLEHLRNVSFLSDELAKILRRQGPMMLRHVEPKPELWTGLFRLMNFPRHSQGEKISHCESLASPGLGCESGLRKTAVNGKRISCFGEGSLCRRGSGVQHPWLRFLRRALRSSIRESRRGAELRRDLLRGRCLQA